MLLFQTTIIETDRFDGILLLNEHGDLYFLFHNLSVQIIPFKTKKIKKKIIGRKKGIPKNVHKAPYPGMQIMILKTTTGETF